MRRSPLSAGRKSLERGATFASRGDGLRRAPSKRRASFTPASSAQREKVRFAACIACAATPATPAHLAPRAHGGCDHDLCVVPLCFHCHRAFDDGRLDLLPHLSGQGYRAELAHMQMHYDDPVSVLVRLSGMRWEPAAERVA